MLQSIYIQHWNLRSILRSIKALLGDRPWHRDIGEVGMVVAWGDHPITHLEGILSRHFNWTWSLWLGLRVDRTFHIFLLFFLFLDHHRLAFRFLDFGGSPSHLFSLLFLLLLDLLLLLCLSPLPFLPLWLLLEDASLLFPSVEYQPSAGLAYFEGFGRRCLWLSLLKNHLNEVEALLNISVFYLSGVAIVLFLSCSSFPSRGSWHFYIIKREIRAIKTYKFLCFKRFFFIFCFYRSSQGGLWWDIGSFLDNPANF